MSSATGPQPAIRAAAPLEPESVWTMPFALALIATTSLFLGFYFLLPTLPPYAGSLGATKTQIGLLITALSLAAMCARLVAAGAMDRHGRKMFLFIGLALCGGGVALYLTAHDLGTLLAFRALHGIGWGLATTGFGALIADLAPPARRGEAIGYWGLAPTTAMALGPLAGEGLLKHGGFTVVFGATTVLAALAIALVAPIREPRRAVNAAARPRLHVPRGALLPAAVLFLSSLSYGALVAFLPLQLAATPGRSGLFFTVYAAAILIARPLGGRLSDRHGRVAVVFPGLAIGAVGTAVLGFAPALWAVITAALLYGIGIGGGVFPVLMAFTVDRCPPEERSSAIATFQTAYDLSIALGAALLGPIYQHASFLAMNLVAAAGVAASVLLLAALVRREHGAPHAVVAGANGSRG